MMKLRHCISMIAAERKHRLFLMMNCGGHLIVHIPDCLNPIRYGLFGFIGYRGFEKFIKELPNWKNELSKEDYDKILYNMVQFFGTVPTIPNALRGIDEADTISFGGGFDKAAVVLSDLGKEYHDTGMAAANIFGNAAPVINQIKEVIVACLINKHDGTNELPALFSQVANSMKSGFEVLE